MPDFYAVLLSFTPILTLFNKFLVGFERFKKY